MVFSIIMTERCNLSCTYCFEKNKRNISLDVSKYNIIKNFIESYLELDFIVNKEDVFINFNGGEPLLEFENIKKLVKHFQNDGINKFSISTNFTYAKQDVLEYLNDNNFLIQISIDGKKETHDKYRKNKSGEGTFDIVYNNIANLKKIIDSERTSYSMVFTPETVGSIFQNVLFLRDLGANNINISFCTDYFWSDDAKELFKEQLFLIEQYFIDELRNGRHFDISFFSKVMKSTLNRTYKQTCGAFIDQIAILPDLQVLPCVAFIGTCYKPICISDISSIIKEFKIFKNTKINISEICSNCILNDRCHNNCYATNYRLTQTLDLGSEINCWINQLCIIASDRIMKTLIDEKNNHFISKYL